MPSRNRKLLKRRTLKKNRKLKRRITKMRGGAAAAAPGAMGHWYSARPSARPGGMHLDCLDPDDTFVITIGSPVIEFLSERSYDSLAPKSRFSDHAPIVYKFEDAVWPVKNEYISIITWNVGSWGNYLDSINHSYNHKFNLQRIETMDEYTQRLENIVIAMGYLLQNNKPKLGKNHPFLFCQELPFKSSHPNSEVLRDHFKRLLEKNSLRLLCDSSELNEYGLIVQMESESQRFNVLDKTKYWNLTYQNGQQIFPHYSGDKEWRRFEIYYYDFSGKTYYYVNIHAIYTEEPGVIVNFLYRIVDIIQIYRKTKGLGIDGVTIYIIGDYNFNIASPAINDLIGTDYQSTPLNLFANRQLGRVITNMHKLTTRDAEGFSLKDNFGTREPCNIDCILKLDLASG